MSVYAALQIKLSATLQSFRNSVKGQREANAPSKETKPCSWRNDVNLQESVRLLKLMVEKLDLECTKLTVLAKNSPPDEVMASLLAEIVPQVHNLGMHFHTSFMTTSASFALYLVITMPLHHFLNKILDLINALEAKDLKNTPKMAGMVTELREQFEKVPATNKVALRRTVMEKLGGVKETLQEFDEYVHQHEAGTYKTEAMDTGIDVDMDMLEEGGEDEDEDEDEEDGYSPEELQIVKDSLDLIRVAHISLKTGMSTMCEVADAATPLPSNNANNDNVAGGETHDSVSSVFSAVEQAAAAEGLNEGEGQQQCSLWVAAVMQHSDIIERSVLNLGAELYAPLENNGVGTVQNYNTLKEALRAQLVTLGAVGDISRLIPTRPLLSPSAEAAYDALTMAVSSLDSAFLAI